MDTREKTRTARPQGRPASAARKTAPRKKAPTATKTRTKSRTQAPKQPEPELVYTQPGPFNTTRFLLRLITVIAVVFALVFGMSIFFKVKVVTVAGANKYTPQQVKEASGIMDGENLLSISEAKLSTNIKNKLPYVDTVRVGIKLPDTVKIEIEELDVVYSVEAEDGSWWLMRADGVIVDKTNAAEAEQKTKIVGLKIAVPTVGQEAVAFQPENQETTEEGQTPAASARPTEQLDAAISIIGYLEGQKIIGDAASVNVTDLTQLEFWYKDRFQVLLGDLTQLSSKIQWARVAIDEHMQTYDSGVLDVSLTIQPDPEKEYQVIYTPFS
ncbi:MAG: FtsQ-type POTRA domain-containing protein [Oscillospiraceae bacterium]|nr:FtsQ-type POTRA domain-containing protein [Oscillospiraceae bacterium]